MRATSLVLLCAVLISAAPAQEPPRDNRSLGDIARDLRQKKAGVAVASMQLPADPEKAFGQEMRQFLSSEDFAQLEKAADAARNDKTRFAGGVWKLFIFYEAISQPAGGDKAADAAWQAHLAKQQRWTTAYPQSITARVAMAETYHGWAWAARGTGYSDTVSDDGWKQMRDREEMARQTLVEASALKAKDPHWYEAMQHVAMGQGWDKAKLRALLDAAMAFEPTYYHYYREHANMLLPRWYGEDGEAEAFAEEISTHIGGKQGAFIYFEIATVLNCLCGNEDHLSTMSWDKIKAGYAALEELYGTSKLKRNRFALMAAKARDKESAHRAFVEIGDDWEPNTWIRKASFDGARTWAMQ